MRIRNNKVSRTLPSFYIFERRHIMGQHKHNPTAIAAEKGEIASKPAKLGRREVERLLNARIKSELAAKTGIPEDLFKNSY